MSNPACDTISDRLTAPAADKTWSRAIVHRTDPNAAGESAKPSQSVVIPTFNEADRIDDSIETVLDYLARQPYEAEVIVVNDGSTDDTLSRAGSWENRSDRVTVLDIPHAGKAAAVRRGVVAATGELIAFSDADLATPI